MWVAFGKKGSKFVFSDLLVQVQSQLSRWRSAPLLSKFNLIYYCELLTSKLDYDDQECQCHWPKLAAPGFFLGY